MTTKRLTMFLQNSNKLYLLFLTSIAFLLTACGGGSSSSSNDLDPNLEPGSLLSSSFIRQNSSLLYPYKVNSYKIVYTTVDTKGKQIKASGLLSIPDKASNAKSPILSYQHGTVFTDSGVPSQHSSTIDTVAFLAGDGYIVSSPDYLGYAESTDILHPYVHAESLASSSIDMIRASKAYLASKNILINNQLFLAGYSEGGYATIALQKEIQENPSLGLTTTASAAGAGPYDLSESAKTLANKVTNNNPSYMNFVVKAYDSIYELNKVSEMYKAPYRDIINNSFDGSKSGSQIDSLLPSTTADLFEADFLALLQGSGSHPLKDAFALNNIYDWSPNAPTLLYHDVQDEVVPYSNTVKAIETMEANGSTSISYKGCALNGHVECAVPYALEALSFLSIYAEDL